MVDDATATSDGAASEPTLRLRDAEGHISDDFLGAVTTAIAQSDKERLNALVGEMHEADLGDLIEALPAEERPRLIELIGEAFDFTALTELDETIRVQILQALSPEVAAAGIGELDSDDAVYILEDLEPEEQRGILEQLPVLERRALERSLDYPDDSAGRLMQTDFIAVPPFWTVGETIDYMRESENLPEDFYEIFVVDPAFRPVGAVALNRILRARRHVQISEITDEIVQKVEATTDQEEVARLFERYNLVETAVIDASGRLVGVITVDDVVDVIQAEADEDIRRLAGVGDEETSDNVIQVARSRGPWLLINTVTAFIAAAVIDLFDGSIEQMVALAVLMPIVASMGGNAGTQAMTVTVRALATRDIGRHNSRRAINREIIVGLINGFGLALLVGTAAALWFDNIELGFVIGAALIVNLFAAGLFGVLIPLGLARLGIDPAIASAVFLTMVTDVIGFFAFLGLAAWWFGLF